MKRMFLVFAAAMAMLVSTSGAAQAAGAGGWSLGLRLSGDANWWGWRSCPNPPPAPWQLMQHGNYYQGLGQQAAPMPYPQPQGYYPAPYGYYPMPAPAHGHGHNPSLPNPQTTPMNPAPKTMEPPVAPVAPASYVYPQFAPVYWH